MTGPQLATRVMRARVDSVCGLCDRLIRQGNQIGKIPGRAWAHVGCIIAAQKTTAAAPPTKETT